MIRKLYPGGKRRAFSVSYDDGVLQDVRFVELLDRYGLRGTFNLNSGLMETEFAWTHPGGMTVRRLSRRTAADLYGRHEVASHTRTHPYMERLGEAEALREMREDREALENLFGREVLGFAVPFTYYSPMLADCARRCGFVYARCSEESRAYAPPADFYWWRPGIFHLAPELSGFVDGFLASDEELALCQIVGHSYDLDAEGLWGEMEDLFRRVASDGDTQSMTSLELARYLAAMDRAQVGADGIRNGSGETLWFEVDGAVTALPPGGRAVLEERR